MGLNKFEIEQTAQERTYYEGPTEITGDERHHIQYLSYRTKEGLVVGDHYSVTFTFDRPAKEVWPYFKDLNSWQSEHRHYYTGVVGDLEGRTFGLRLGSPSNQVVAYYEVVKSIPEYLFILNQPIPTDGSTAGLPGRVGVSPGFHVFMLQEYQGKTTATVLMTHSTLSNTENVEEALMPWRDICEKDALPKWRLFIRTLKRLVYEGH